MDREDYVSLLKTADNLEILDKHLRELAGGGHGNGKLCNLDNIYELLQKYADKYYGEDDAATALFFRIVEDTTKTPEERADILMNGTMKC